jgi:hypothetical protein
MEQQYSGINEKDFHPAYAQAEQRYRQAAGRLLEHEMALRERGFAPASM